MVTNTKNMLFIPPALQYSNQLRWPLIVSAKWPLVCANTSMLSHFSFNKLFISVRKTEKVCCGCLFQLRVGSMLRSYLHLLWEMLIL